MKLLILFTLSLTQFFMSDASPLMDDGSAAFIRDMAAAAGENDYLNAMPYSKEQIRAVKAKLNLTYEDNDSNDEYLSVVDLIRKYGYPVEEHFTTTKDGYILRMHRIPPTRKGIAPCNRTIFLMHGVLMSSADWVILGPHKAMAYYLSDLGYDVWMGNARGNYYSRNHTKLSPSSRKFWKFSWHEVGTTDLPAMIDYVLKTTNQKALYHVGHSQGTTTFYVMCSEKTEYNKKIIAHYSLAPIAYMKHSFSPLLRFASKFVKLGEAMTWIFGVNEVLPHNKLMTWLGNAFCSAGELSEVICKDVLFLITGFDKAEFNDTLLPTILGHTPAGAAARQLWHYAQLIDSGHFRKYDYFPLNALHYGPLHPIWPPSYNLKHVKAPVYLYYSKNDWLSNEKDVTQLCKDLGNCKAQTLVAENLFNHLDYAWGIHAKERIYTVVANDIVSHFPTQEQLGEYEEEVDEIERNEFYEDSYYDDEE